MSKSLRKESQANRILRRLSESTGSWVRMPALAAVGKCYAVHSRIADLRKRGYEIECRVERSKDRTCQSFYRVKP